MKKLSTPPAEQSKQPSPNLLDSTNPELTEEEMAFEMVELTCDELDSLSRAFTMISELCAELSQEVEQEIAEDLENLKIH
jgi:hypothetical protein